ncbi:MAG: rhodanese-like domain-containing protein [Anaerolineales bacterium]|nr:rhodanese-like domain-containing protein [Anaerolineales bacterium]
MILDCRFSLSDKEYGFREYVRAHIPGAIYAHLDADLCAPVVNGVTGRHPLPSPEQAEAVFSRWGISPGVQVVAYDDQAGALAAGRAWWLLRWLGHTDAAVLDGGWQAWTRANLSVTAGIESGTAGHFHAKMQTGLVVTSEEVNRLRLDLAYRVFDSRLPERYAGLVEPIDPVADLSASWKAFHLTRPFFTAARVSPRLTISWRCCILAWVNPCFMQAPGANGSQTASAQLLLGASLPSDAY